MKNLKKIDYRYYIIFSFIFISLLFSFFYFSSTLTRLGESLRDFCISLRYYFEFLFFDEVSISATVTDFSSLKLQEILKLPNSWEDFSELMSSYWLVFLDKNNFEEYIFGILLFLNNFSLLVLFLLPIFILLIVLFNLSIKKKNIFHGKESKPLIVFKKFTKKYLLPIKFWFLDFFNFFKCSRKIFKILLVLIWCYNFNFFTIVLEFVAYYLYFVCSFDIISLYVQVVKLLADLLPLIFFFAWYVWLIFGLFVFNKIRKRIGYRRLNHWEMKNRGFINSLPIVVMGCGTMGSKKTTMITDMGLSQEVIFRDKAFELLLENDLKFPYFPWIRLENALKIAIDKHIVYNLATCKQFIDNLHDVFLKTAEKDRLCIRAYYKRKFGFNLGKNLLFDYDFKRYGFTFDDKLKTVDVWEVIKTYSQLYFFYTVTTSLLISNYSIRTDNIKQDLGNFPLWNTDFFKRDSRLLDSFSRHSHIIDFDMLRLGKKVIKDNPYSDLFEFGILLVTEIGKERGNMLELSEKKKGSTEANQKNDLFDSQLKMIRHFGTVDNYPFVKFFCDEQRPESWGANGRDLCNILHMEQSSSIQLSMPFFALEELIFAFVKRKFIDTYSEYRFYRGDNTLFMYLIKAVVSKYYNYYKGVYNTFGFMDMSLLIENGTQDGAVKEHKYKLMVKKIYSKRFSTDCHSGFFLKKSLNSSLGINDLPEYSGDKATIEELKTQNSYFIDDLNSGLSEYENL